MSRLSTHSDSDLEGASTALVVSVVLPEHTEAQARASIAELTRLAATLGIEVLDSIVQRREAIGHSYLGEGKLREVAERMAELREQRGVAPWVLVDGELTPGQQRALERALEAQHSPTVLDRTALILRIFELRAQTQRARLEVEIARLAYALPRQRDDATVRDKQGGGAGRGERGHTATTLAKQQLRRRLAQLRKELSALQASDAQRRVTRGSSGPSRVALVGYTNAGKSSLMRALTTSRGLVEDKLFATLSVTTRALVPETRPAIVLSDTVGFIQRLPHELVASFRATLDEARDAELLLLVADASDPAFKEQLAVTEHTLDALELNVPRRIVLNKIDRVPLSEQAALAAAYPDALLVSAHDAQDVARLHAAIVEAIDAGLSEAELTVPYAQSALCAEIHAASRVVEERFADTAAVLRVRARDHAIERWKSALTR